MLLVIHHHPGGDMTVSSTSPSTSYTSQQEKEGKLERFKSNRYETSSLPVLYKKKSWLDHIETTLRKHRRPSYIG